MKTVKIGILGIGNIAKGTYTALEMNRQHIESKTGISIEVSKILNRKPDLDRGIDIPKEKYVTNAYDIINDPEIDIVVELIGGIEPATEFMAAALANGKHVVTANKAAIAANGMSLQKQALDSGVNLRFEASVGGGIPVINAITTALAANEFNQVLGIVNGTTNYILTQMTEYGREYVDVLKDAQEKGFAETDPTADVEGIDVANKLSILISLVFGISVPPSEIPTKGITTIGAEDIHFANEFGYKIKLLAASKLNDGKVSANVMPSLVPVAHPLASVNNEFNAIHITGNAVDDLMLYGKGAGPLPTASAVVGDIIEIAKAIDKDCAFDKEPLLIYDADAEFIGDGVNKYYLRASVNDEAGVLGTIASILGKHGVGIETVIQRADKEGNGYVPLIFTVHEVSKATLDEALDELVKTNAVKSIDNVLQVLQ